MEFANTPTCPRILSVKATINAITYTDVTGVEYVKGCHQSGVQMTTIHAQPTRVILSPANAYMFQELGHATTKTRAPIMIVAKTESALVI